MMPLEYAKYMYECFTINKFEDMVKIEVFVTEGQTYYRRTSFNVPFALLQFGKGQKTGMLICTQLWWLIID